MSASESAIIVCHHREGEKLDVAGLNQITVLVDRSRTALTEVGWNVWHAGLEGPPHFHDQKEQVFFVTGGTGTITLGGDSYRVGPNHLIHVPMGVMHRTEVDPGEPLAYILYNAFRDSQKEGHASFAAHIKEAKHERRQQADAAAQGAAIDWSRVDKVGTHVVVNDGDTAAEGSADVISLLKPLSTYRCAVDLISKPAEAEHILEGMKTCERSLFAIGGTAILITADGSSRIGEGDVAYVPADTTVIIRTGSTSLRILCFTTILA